MTTQMRDSIKKRKSGNFHKIKTFYYLAKRLIDDNESLTYELDQKQHKIETVLLNAATGKDRNKNYLVLFYEKNFIEQFTTITRLYIDKTYKMQLHNFVNSMHFFTIMIEIECKVYNINFHYCSLKYYLKTTFFIYILCK